MVSSERSLPWNRRVDLTQPFYIDADAVHWTSIRDIRQTLPHGYSLHQVEPDIKGLRGLLYRKLMVISVEIRKDD